MIKELIKVADYLDRLGLEKEANLVDGIIQKWAGLDDSGFLELNQSPEKGGSLWEGKAWIQSGRGERSPLDYSYFEEPPISNKELEKGLLKIFKSRYPETSEVFDILSGPWHRNNSDLFGWEFYVVYKDKETGNIESDGPMAAWVSTSSDLVAEPITVQRGDRTETYYIKWEY
jgi:hypothetical protein